MELDKSPRRIGSLFDTIARRYDFMNDAITLFAIRRTRKIATQISQFSGEQKALDLATGTGELAFLLYKKGGGRTKVVGIDISEKMLQIAKARSKKHGYAGKIEFLKCDANNLSFPDNLFNICTISFGIRNVSDPKITLKEMLRVTKAGGKLIIVEITPPTKRFNRYFITFYFDKIVPKIAKLLSSNSSAYNYLARSVRGFPTAPLFTKTMESVGWKNVTFIPLYLGTVTIFVAVK